MQQNREAATAAEQWKKDHPDAKPEEVKKQDEIITNSRAQNDAFVDQKPDNPKIQILGAETSFDAHDAQKTLERAANAEKLSQGDDKPLAAQAAYWAGRAHLSENDPKAALEDFQRAHDYDPTNKDVAIQLELLQGHNLGAIGIKATKDPFTAQANGADQRLVGATKAPTSQAASGSAGSAPAMSPEAARLFRDAEGKLQLDPKAAEDLADKILALDGNNANGYFLRGLARKQQAAFARAVEDFTKAIALGLKNALVYAARSATYEAQRELADAESDAREAARLDPRNGARLLHLGQIQAEEGKKDEAAASLAQAQTLDPSLASAASALERQYDLGAPAPPTSAAQAAERRRGWLMVLAAIALLAGAAGVAMREKLRAFWGQGGATTGGGGRGRARRGHSVLDDTPATTGGLAAGVHLGHYELRKPLGRGGMGEVWEAFDHSLNRLVAIKKLVSGHGDDPKAVEMLVDEALNVAKLKHPNIMAIHFVFRGQQTGDVYLVFEHLSEGTVLDKLDDGPLPPERAAAIVRGVAEALDYAHGQGVIHRDLKPSNILLERGLPKVADFGIAKLTQHSEGTMTVTNAGTPAYMAPEQSMGVVSRATDLYALAVTAYQIVTGVLPFPASKPDLKMSGEFIPATQRAPALPHSADAFFTRALNPDPKARFKDGAEFAAEFERAVASVTPLPRAA